MLASPSRCLSHRRVLGAGLVIKAFLSQVLRSPYSLDVFSEANRQRRMRAFLLYSKKEGLWEKIGDTPNFSRCGK